MYYLNGKSPCFPHFSVPLPPPLHFDTTLSPTTHPRVIKSLLAQGNSPNLWIKMHFDPHQGLYRPVFLDIGPKGTYG